MSIITSLLKDPKTIGLSILVGLLTFVVSYIVVFYRRVKQYPPGPFPYPLIGNFLIFRQKKHVHEILLDAGRTFGKVYTVWFGTTPFVFINDSRLGIYAFRDMKHDVSGRPKLNTEDIFTEGKGTDIVLADYGRTWEVLRRVAHSAVRKYAFSDALIETCRATSDKVLTRMKDHGDKGFDMNEHMRLLMNNLLSSSAYGKNFDLDDPEFEGIVTIQKKTIEYQTFFLTLEILPFMRYIFPGKYKLLVENLHNDNENNKKYYDQHRETFDRNNIRDFTDALLAAKMEAEEEEDLDTKEHLTDWNLVFSVMDLFAAGSETTRSTLLWFWLFTAKKLDLQRKMRREVYSVCEEETPTNEHRVRCNYTMAFLSEVMRFRSIVAGGVFHKAIKDIKLGGFNIPKDTAVQYPMIVGLTDPEFWDKPDEFIPERFLKEDGTLNPRPTEHYIPFGVGRRSCIGEKMAIADMFMIIARFMQQTKGSLFVLPDGPDSISLDGDMYKTNAYECHDYNLKIVKDE